MTQKKLYEFRGKAQDLFNWSKELGVPHSTLYGRLGNGWSIEEAFTRPVDESFKGGPNKAISKNEGELYLNDLAVEKLPKDFQQFVHGVRCKKYGRYIREMHGKAFTKWFNEVFCKMERPA